MIKIITPLRVSGKTHLHLDQHSPVVPGSGDDAAPTMCGRMIVGWPGTASNLHAITCSVCANHPRAAHLDGQR